jgi:hypothetical protein
MKIRHACLLSVLAGLAASATAQDFAGPLPIREITLPVVGAPAQPYAGRAIQTTYDCLSNTFGNGSATHLGACANVIEDISFANSAWALPGYTLPRVITEITYGVAVITTPTTTEDIMLIFWDEDDVNFQGQGGANTPMIAANAIPLAVVRVDAAGLNAGFYWQITNNLTGLAGGGVTVPADDNGIALQIAWVSDGFTPPDTNGDSIPNWENLAGGLAEPCPSATNRSIVFGSQSGAPVLGNPASPGFTTPSYGRDMLTATMCASAGVFLGNGGAPAAGGDVEHRFINASPQRGMMVRFKGDVVIPPPACNVTQGAIPDAGATAFVSVPAAGVSIVCFTLNGDATDAAGQFLDIDTEGTVGDAAIALWDSGGALVAFDDDGGSGTNAKLSFGIGIRQKVGDGTQYNGRDGQLAAGTYYLGVATGAAGDSSFGDSFTRSSTGPGGVVAVNFTTNTNGSPLAPSVAPDLTEAAFNGGNPLTAPGAQSAATATGLRGLLWYSFNVCDIADPANYLDIDTNSGSTPTADTEIFLFDDAGNLVATDDDSGSAALSQLSFGNVGPRPAPGDGLPYAGQNGNLPAGTYYVGIGLFNVDTAPSNNRWHLRATSGSNLIVQLTLTTDSDGVCSTSCHGDCVADFDDGSGTGTPDGGVTIDDLLYYLVLFEDGVLCADVDDGSGTGTTDGGVTIDDLLYYLVRFESGC